MALAERKPIGSKVLGDLVAAERTKIGHNYKGFPAEHKLNVGFRCFNCCAAWQVRVRR